MSSFSPGDVVQPRMGGPKLIVMEVHEDQILTVPAANEQGAPVTLKTADVTLYKEDGDFGVC